MALLLGSVAMLRAQDRFFAYSYNSPNLLPGGVDIEPWITFKWNGSNSRLKRTYEQRLEFEFGLFKWLQTSFYLNQKATAYILKDTLRRNSSFSFSHALKFWLLNPSVHPIGLSFYLEYYLYPQETELEFKIITDKWFNRHILVANLTGEYAFEYEAGELEPEQYFVLNPTLGSLTQFG